MFDSSYDFVLYPHFKRLIKSNKPIVRQQTCPTCARTLVNLYKRDGVWKCKKCWDAEGRAVPE